MRYGFILALLASLSWPQDVPFTPRGPSPDTSGVNRNFMELSLRQRDDVGGASTVGNYCWDSPSLCVDSTNHRVGVSTAAPASALEIGAGGVLMVSSITTNGGGQVYVGTSVYVNGTLSIIGIATFTTYVDIGTETIINDCGSASTCRATCSSGKRIMGGGCAHAVNVFGQGYPDATNSYYCTISNTQQLTAYAICARIQ